MFPLSQNMVMTLRQRKIKINWFNSFQTKKKLQSHFKLACDKTRIFALWLYKAFDHLLACML